MRDLVTSATLAFQYDDSNAQKEQQLEKTSWRELARNYWKATAADSSDKSTHKRQFHRTKSYEWIVATSHMLMIAMGKTWLFFKPAAGASPESWPCATVTVDQGSDGWSAAWFLQMAMGVNMMLMFDWSHRTWNDVSLAISDCGLTYYCLLTIIILNCDHGPWNGHKWWHEVKAGGYEYTRQVAGDNDPLFEASLHQMCHDIDDGCEALSSEDAKNSCSKLCRRWSSARRKELV